MTTKVKAGTARSFDSGRVIRRVTGIRKSNWLIFTAGSLLVFGVPSFAVAWLTPKLLTMTFIGNSLTAATGRLVIQELGGFLIAGCGALLSAWVTLTLVRDFVGEIGADVGQSARDVARAAGAIFVIGVAYAAGVLLGTLLLLAPGVILACAWYVATPVVIYEHRSIRSAFARSLDLTRGHRGSIFGFLFVLGLAGLALNLTAMRLVSPGLSFAAMGRAPISKLIVVPLLGLIEHLINSAVMASIYIELVELKDGGFRSAVLAAFE